MIAIVDYGVGNLFSLAGSFAEIGEAAVVTGDPDVIRSCDHVVLPGVGAFADAANKLRQTGLDLLICNEAARGKPLLGICLGMQMLFDVSFEYGEHRGLGLIPGKVVPLRPVVPPNYKIPHIGWNGLTFPKDREKSRLYAGVDEGDCVYFVHSFYAVDCSKYITATAEYGAEVTASVEKGNVFGTQFHPEKSGSVGLAILKAFARI